MKEVIFLLALYLVCPPLLVAALRRTMFFWIPGMGLIAFALVFLAEVGGGIDPVASDLNASIGTCSLIYGAVCLVVGWRLRSRAIHQRNAYLSPSAAGPPPPADLPTAVVRRDVSES